MTTSNYASPSWANPRMQKEVTGSFHKIRQLLMLGTSETESNLIGSSSKSGSYPCKGRYNEADISRRFYDIMWSVTVPLLADTSPRKSEFHCRKRNDLTRATHCSNREPRVTVSVYAESSPGNNSSADLCGLDIYNEWIVLYIKTRL